MSERQPEALWLVNNRQHAHTLAWQANACAELRRLHQHELANIEWLKKTEWVQDTVHYSELGMHRADVIKQRFDRLHEVNQELLKALKDSDALIAQLMPGIKHIVLQDYGFLNDTLHNNRAAIEKATGENK